MASLRKKKLPKPSPATNQPKLGVHTTEASPIALGLAQGFLVFYLLAASCYNFRSQLEVPKCQFTNTFAMPARPALSALSSTSSRKSRVRSAPARKPPSSFRSLLRRTALPLVPRPSPPHRPVEAAVAAAAVAAATERGTAISACALLLFQAHRSGILWIQQNRPRDKKLACRKARWQLI